MSKDSTLKLLEEIMECCCFEDDNGEVQVTENAIIPIELFDRLCTEIKQRQIAVKI